MDQEYNQQFIGKGEDATFSILKHLTGLNQKSLKDFPFKSGLYRQVPLKWIISLEDYDNLSDAHRKGTIDIFLVLNQTKIAIRVQGPGHGEHLKGIGKVRHDTVQEKLIRQYCQLVDIQKRECKEIFKERVTNKAIQEIQDSFKTFGVEIPKIV